jgi:hypothetical protein
MTQPLAQYHENTLQPIEIESSALQEVLNKLLLAIRQGLSLLKAQERVPQGVSQAVNYGSISHGDLGGCFDAI